MSTRAPAPASSFTIYQLWAYALVVGVASTFSHKPHARTGPTWESVDFPLLLIALVGVLILHAFVLRYAYSLPSLRALGVGAAAGIVWTACGVTTGAWDLVGRTMALLMLVALPITTWRVIRLNLSERGKAATVIHLTLVVPPLLLLVCALASIVTHL